LIPALIALYFLSQGSTENKAKAICDIFSDYTFFQEDSASTGIFGLQRLRETQISKDQLHCIISTFTNLALVLLPLYASNFPNSDKRQYIILLVEWQKRCSRVIEHFVSEFKGGIRSKITNSISVEQFINKAKELDIFEILMIREVAKNTLMIDLPRETLNVADGPGSQRSFNFEQSNQSKKKKEN
jgi:hypothetical protein